MARYLLLALLLASVSQAQSGKELFDAAEAEFRKLGPREAITGFTAALSAYQAEHDPAGEARTLNAIGICYRRLGLPKAALDEFQRSLAIKERLGDRLEQAKTINNIGLAQADLSEHRQALANYRRALALVPEALGTSFEGNVENNIALSLMAQGSYETAREHLRRALEIDQDNGNALENMGGTYQLVGRNREALQYYERALQLNRGTSGEGHALGNLALARLGLGEIAEAIRTYDEAIDLAHRQLERGEEADWRKGKGSALRHAGQYDDALREYRLAISLYDETHVRQKKVEALTDLGYLHLTLGDLVEAERQFNSALALARSLRDQRNVIANFLALGDLAVRRKLYPQALRYYTSAQTAAGVDGNRAAKASATIQIGLVYRDRGIASGAALQAEQALAIAREIDARLLEAQALYTLGEAHRLAGRFEPALDRYTEGEVIAAGAGDTELSWRLAYGACQSLQRLNRIADAVKACHRAVETIEAVRSRLREERFEAGYVEDKYQVYVLLVRLMLEQDRLAEAFGFAERLHARTYAELVGHGAPRARSNEERELHERIRQLQQALDRENAREHPENRSDAVDSLSRELAEAEREYTNLLDDLQASDPEFAEAGLLAAPRLDEVQGHLPAGTALIEYLVADDRVLAFVITAQQVHARTLRVAARDLTVKVELLRDLIKRPPGDDWRGPAGSLSELLIAPLRAQGWLTGIRRLYIVPHRVLHYLPFGALPTGPRMLADDFAIAYLPAAAALTRSGNAAATPRGNPLLALAPARAGLKHTAEEVNGIRSFFSPGSVVLTGLQATEAAFKRDAGNFDVLHLATHASFNKRSPMLSALILEPGAAEDGKLEVREILGLRLNAGLVTLSACDSAMASGYFNDAPPGDDLVGLTRAFLYAGSRAVVASLWEVDDVSTAALMHLFYAGAKNGDRARALAAAQAALRKQDPKYQHPYYWAPFILSGKMD